MVVKKQTQTQKMEKIQSAMDISMKICQSELKSAQKRRDEMGYDIPSGTEHLLRQITNMEIKGIEREMATLKRIQKAMDD